MTPQTAPLSHSLYMADFTQTIWVSKKPDFEKKVKHLNKILCKHGKPPITYTYSEPRTMPVKFTFHTKGDSYANDSVRTYNVEVCDVHCRGLTTIQKDDAEYCYLGTVTFTDGVKQVFCNNEAYANYFMDDFRPNYCDHCHTTRTNRNTYFLFRNTTTNKVLQIGSTCVKEYFGIDSDAFLKTYGNTFLCGYDGDEEELMHFHGGSSTYSLTSIIPAVSYCTKGFLKWHKASEGAAYGEPLWEQPTSSAVDSMIGSWISPDPIYPTDGDRNNAALLTAEEIVSFWQAKYDREKSTFAYNCLNAVKAGYTTYRSLGSFCYAIFAAYNAKVRAMQEAEAAKNTKIVPCAYPVSSRQNLSGIITNIRSFTDENCWDGYHYDDTTKYIVDFTESNGTLYHFITSGVSFSNLRNGDSVSIRATIGDTKPFKGIPYTRLSRPVATLVSRPTTTTTPTAA